MKTLTINIEMESPDLQTEDEARDFVLILRSIEALSHARITSTLKQSIDRSAIILEVIKDRDSGNEGEGGGSDA